MKQTTLGAIVAGRPEKAVEHTGQPRAAELARRLRELRDRAGTPSYRVMAARVHYSASTLAAAASGRRMPTDEVLAAYVTACGEDPAAWLAEFRAARTGAPAEAPGALPELPVRRVPRWSGRKIAAAAFVLVVVSGGLIWWSGKASWPAPQHSAGAPPAGTSGCPDWGAGRFPGRAHPDGVIVRTGPGKDYPPVGTRIQGGCVLALTGYCFGQTVSDAWLDMPDNRWFLVPGGHYVASAVVLGNPPPDLAPQPCAGGRAAPELGTVTAIPAAGQVRVRIRGHDLPLVGIATLTGNGPWTHAGLHPVPGELSGDFEVPVAPGTPAFTVAACAAASAPAASAVVVDLHAPKPAIVPVTDPQARHAACRASDSLTPHQ